MRRANKQHEINIGNDVDVDRHHSQLFAHAQSIAATGRDFVSDDLDDCLKKSHDNAFHLGMVEALADLRINIRLEDGKMDVVACLLTQDHDTYIERSVPIDFFIIETPEDSSWVHPKVSHEEDDDAITIKFWKARPYD